MFGLSQEERAQRKLAREELQPRIADGGTQIAAMVSDWIRPLLVAGKDSATEVFDLTEVILLSWDSAFERKISQMNFIESIAQHSQSILDEDFTQEGWFFFRSVTSEEWVPYVFAGKINFYVCVEFRETTFQ